MLPRPVGPSSRIWGSHRSKEVACLARRSVRRIVPLLSPTMRGNMSAWQMCLGWSAKRIWAPGTYPNASRITRVEVSAANEIVCFGRNSRPTRWGGRAGPVELDDTDHAGRCKMGNSQEGRAGGPKGAILAAAPPGTSLSQQTRAAGCVREGPVAQSAASRRGSHRRERDHLSLQRGVRFRVTLTRYPDIIVSGRDGAN